ncbi:selenocysteine-specific translation elongation factor [Paenalcaligenes hominis]|uniref:Selenocysteine-specific elongation factor n=1 Tax=Paenalcaligenes hominis TaxID=643674 RepID=A0A1U9JXH5_9BURK|nr:selenocysteine-specific translation elongation factor [Paenalcaligenes hominis]AQS50429.1 selenocysteine-specific translation elongation factor [Paenalcaligenes hominis]
MIVGTAGHIDHGKTALVRALTGVNTDRLDDEKQRGITITLGYAYTPLVNGDVLGFVDVPGHENLVHTMVAGATGIDYALLVVAADDGIMPQTHEHVAILSLLGLKRGSVVINKADRADPEAIQQLKNDLQQLLQHTFLADALYFETDSLSGQGIEALKAHLEDQAMTVAQRHSQGLFRLAVDRVFTLEGQGTVLTGTVHSGQIAVQDDQSHLRLMPQNKAVRIRSIHAQNTPSPVAKAGQRCALNIAGIAKEEIERGNWIADSHCFVPSTHIDVRLKLLAYGDTTLKTWTPVHVHVGAAHYVAHVVPLSQDLIRSNQTAFAQLVFDEPVCVMPGDRFIVRNAQAKLTIGGGQVLDANAPDRKRRSLARLAWLDAVEMYLDGKGIAPLLRQAPYGLDQSFLHRLTATEPTQLELPAESLWVRAPRSSTAQVLIHNNAWEQLLARIETVLAETHERYPDEPGVEAARLRRMVAPRAPDSLWFGALHELLQRQRLALNGPWYRLSGHTVSFSPKEEAIALQLIRLCHEGRYNPPWVRDMAQTLEVPEDELRALGRKLVRQGVVYQVVRDLYYHRDAILELAARLADLAEPNGVKAAEFRDSLALGRKRTIQILEFFERIGYTRRLRDKHLIRSGNTVFNQTTLERGLDS